MSLSEIHKAHLCTVEQVYESNGKHCLDVTFPYSKESLTFSSDDPQGLVEYANGMILGEIEKEQVVTPYRNAVEALSTLCLTQDGSGANAAAQVLLGTFNSQWFHLKVVDLCSLDASNFKYAMDLIKGRVMTMEEPHHMIDDGNEIFRKLWERWSHLAIDERYKEHYQD